LSDALAVNIMTVAFLTKSVLVDPYGDRISAVDAYLKFESLNDAVGKE
jgi:hypothetical protein